MSRRTLLISIIAAALTFVILISYLIYSFFSRPAAPPTTAPTTEVYNPPAATGQVVSSRITQVSQNAALNYFQAADGTVYYVRPTGEIMQVNQGKEEALTSSFSNLAQVQFSSDGQKILFGFSNSQFSIFDIPSSTWQSLNGLGNLQSAAFSPASSTQIAYLKTSGLMNELDISDFSKSKVQTTKISSFSEQDLNLSWLFPDKIFLYPKPTSYFAAPIISFSLKDKTAQINSAGNMISWLSDFNKSLVFVSDASRKGGVLNLADQNGQAISQFDFLTLPSKCVGALGPQNANFVYCAVPRDTRAFSYQSLPESYLMRSFYTSDDIIRVDLGANKNLIIFNDPSQYFDMTNLKVFGGSLYFVNRYDQKVYKIGLP